MCRSLTAPLVIALLPLKVPPPLWEPPRKTLLLSSSGNWKQNHSYVFWVWLFCCFSSSEDP